MKATHNKEVFLHPGDWHFADKHTRIRTLLGSCVSITLWHPGTQQGGMCHYLLAQRKDQHNDTLSGRYGDEAMLLLLREVLRAQLSLKELKVKLIGGSAVLAGIERDQPRDVPSRNIEMARHLTAQLGLSVQAEDLGGNSPRMVLFDLATGDVWVKQTLEAEMTTLSSRKTRTKA
ncbi:chemotaxis protein CheD [Neisseriaceae bacterium TC5R-5]|nr:chemotaxis protein CheD [Neisseriaceae bacterium TC5R-5]